MTISSPRSTPGVKGKKTVQTTLSVSETENTFYLGEASWDSNFRDRLNYDRLKILTQAVTAWRSNPIGRRIIEITTEFVMGDGFSFTAPKSVEKVLRDFWNHPLNNLDGQLPEWADEAWRTGDLFLLLSVDAGGQVYVRALPSESIAVIETRENDYRQETFYKRTALDENPWPAFTCPSPSPFSALENGDRAASRSEAEGGRGGAGGAGVGAVGAAGILHFPLSRLVGANFGESDLAPVLHWISLYSKWLDDRAQLNYFRQMFSYILQRPYANAAEKEKYKHDFIARIPRKSGSVIFLEPEETLSILNPNLASFEAEADGLALKRMIAAGVGLPMHYLAEPEGSTRTTAEAAGTPTFKRFKRRQQYLVNVVQTLLQAVISIRRRTLPNLPLRPHIDILVPDITERDNANLAIAVQRVVTAFAPLYNAKLIQPKEFIRLVYRFIAETMPETVGDFSPLNIRGGGKTPNTAPDDPRKDDLGNG